MPYFALWLTDLVMTDETSAAVVGGLAHLPHLRSVARVLEQLVSSQRVHYAIAPQLAVADYIARASPVCCDEAALFQMSLLCEPRPAA